MPNLPIHPYLKHPLTGCPLEAVGIVGGRPVWPMLGAEDAPPPADPDKKFTQADIDAAVRDRLARQKAQMADPAELKAVKDELEALKSANQSDLEKAIAKAKQEGRDEAQAESNARLIAAEARALAATGWRISPTAIVKQLDLADVKVNADGSVDTDAIRSKLTDLGKSEPGLVDDGKSTTASAADVGIGAASSGNPDPGPGKARLISAYATTDSTT